MINYFEKEQKSTLILEYNSNLLNIVKIKFKGTEKSIECGWLHLHKPQENLKRASERETKEVKNLKRHS